MPEKNSIIELSVARRSIKKAYILIFAIGIPYLIFVLATDIRLPCIFYETTHLQCPGCGITRMFISLAKLRFQDAFNYNPFAFFFVPITVLWTVFAYIGKPRFFRNGYFLLVTSWIAAFLAVLFGVLRNLC